MHVPDGFMPPAVLIGGYVITGAVTALSLNRINKKEDPRAEIPKAALLTAAFFVASALRIPLPPPLTSVHLLLSGLMGVVLGFYAFPSILIGLILQFLIFGHGGITTIGVNTVIMGTPALISHLLFSTIRQRNPGNSVLGLMGFVSGTAGVWIAVAFFYTLILATIPAEISAEAERNATRILAISHVPLGLIEGVFTGFLVTYLKRVRPDLLGMARELPDTNKTQMEYTLSANGKHPSDVPEPEKLEQ